MTRTQPMLFRCDAGPAVGLGHFVRCLALAEEVATRGTPVLFVSAFGGLDWPARQLRRRGFAHVLAPSDAPALAALATERDAVAVVVDSYAFDRDFFAALAKGVFKVIALDDEAIRELPVDMIVNTNFGAENMTYAARPDTVRLLGADYALLRHDIRIHRAAAAQRTFNDPATRVLVTLGGTDPAGLTRVALAALAKTGLPLSVRVLTGAITRSLGPISGNLNCAALPGVDDIASHMLWCDVALSAAGSTAWELACLGAPMALVPVAENQLVVYGPLVDTGAAVGLDRAADVDAWAAVLGDLLRDRSRRAALAGVAAQLVDGQGAQRVADAIAALASDGEDES